MTSTKNLQQMSTFKSGSACWLHNNHLTTRDRNIRRDNNVISGNVIVEIVPPRDSSEKLLEIMKGSFV